MLRISACCCRDSKLPDLPVPPSIRDTASWGAPAESISLSSFGMQQPRGQVRVFGGGPNI
eukprot:2556136-Prymnesium_polylepis.1